MQINKKNLSGYILRKYPSHIVCHQLNLNIMSNYFLLSMPGGSEWILIIVAVLIMFGGKKIPEFMKGIGKGMREFNDAKNNVKQEFENGMREQEKPVVKTELNQI
jgi:sec-independent protein translocase protein TatA